MARVLLVEDDPDTGESLKAMLELAGHETTWARHGKEAMALLRPEHEVVLTDILMPEMDGIEGIQHIRMQRPEMPIIAMTAQCEATYLRAATLFGAGVVLHKPFGLLDLEQALRKALASRPPAP